MELIKKEVGETPIIIQQSKLPAYRLLYLLIVILGVGVVIVSFLSLSAGDINRSFLNAAILDAAIKSGVINIVILSILLITNTCERQERRLERIGFDEHYGGENR